jgi:hypothetical protein
VELEGARSWLRRHFDLDPVLQSNNARRLHGRAAIQSPTFAGTAAEPMISRAASVAGHLCSRADQRQHSPRRAMLLREAGMMR